MMEKEDVMYVLLQRCLEKDNEKRKKAERDLKQLRHEYPKEFVLEAAHELVDESRSEYTRELAGLMFQSIVKQQKIGNEKKSPWDVLSVEERRNVRDEIIKALATENNNVRAGASSAIAAIACKELDSGENNWKDLIPTLQDALEHPNTSFKLSSIQTVAKICEDVRPSLISSDNAKDLFTTLMHQLNTNDVKLQCQVLEALLVMIPFASHRLSRNEEFSMNLTNLVFEFVLQGAKQDMELMERAWKCMTELAHHFFLSFYDKVGKVLECAFSMTEISPSSSQKQMELFQRCCMLGMETVSILIREEHELIKRKKQNYNIVQEVAEPLTEELLKALKLFNTIGFNVESLSQEIFENIFPATEMALENLVKLMTEKTDARAEKIIDMIRSDFSVSLDSLETKAAGIAMVSCCFAAKDNVLTRDILIKGFTAFLEYLNSSSSFIIERIVKLFDNAFERHYMMLIVNPEYSKPLIEQCSNFKDLPIEIASMLMRIILKFADTAVKMRVSIPDVSLGIIEIMFDVMVRPGQEAKAVDLQMMACQALTKTVTSMQNSASQGMKLKNEVIPTLCDSLFTSMEHLSKLSKQEQLIQDWLMESIAEALLVLQKVTEEQFTKLFELIVEVFNAREEVTGEGLLLFNALLHGSAFEQSEDGMIENNTVTSSVGTMAPFIEHAMRNNYGSKVAMDAMICASTIAMRLRFQSHKFIDVLMTPLGETIGEMNPKDHGHLFVALTAYSDFALYTQALFKPHADEYLKTLSFVGSQIMEYWKDKEQTDGELEFYEFDEDDRMCMNLTEALIDAYHNTVMAAEQGKWRSKLSSIALDILNFYQQVIIKMRNIMGPGVMADLGLAFADFLRSLKDVVFQWYGENMDFMKKFHKHLGQTHQTLVAEAKEGRGPQDEELFEQLLTAYQVMTEWFDKMSLPL